MPLTAWVRSSRLFGLAVLITLAFSAACSESSSPSAPTASPTPVLEPTALATVTPTAEPIPTAPPTATPVPRSSVTVGSATFVVEVARTVEQQTTGLSGRDSLPRDAGMLFPQRQERIASFWMRGMRFPLDFLWITADCRLLEITSNVPPPTPGTPDNALPIYHPSKPVLYVLEVNAGEAAAHGLRPGDPVFFAGSDLRDLGCSRV